MSYSRWGSSQWYTYWCTAGEGVKENRDNAIFEICMVKSFTAKQLREGMDKCISEVKYIEDKNRNHCVSDKGLEELRGYMLDFLEDVNKEYPRGGEADYGPMCGRCYDLVDKLYPPKCDERPEEFMEGQPMGMYHCPDCGTMVLAGLPHPWICKDCINQEKEGFDIPPKEKS